MDDLKEKLLFLDDYKKNKEKYLPLIDHAYKIFPEKTEFGDINIGWNVGIIDGNRPYFCEAWADGFTVLTYFFSDIGIEDYGEAQIEKMLADENIINYVGKRKYPTSVALYTDGFGNTFFSVNIIVGDDDGVYTKCGNIYSLKILNDYNSESKSK